MTSDAHEEKVYCEKCEEPVKDRRDRQGCNKCGAMFGPCCNSGEDGVCVDCVE